ncbi:isocitrate lyase/PEP mutase family protein [Ilumatobacter sp.]|uniref:isocitrate lyase/PEP mutase family protein n=1 Tax=Ilumatobacter sp. TaxID=1967498 RepID=UPI003C3BC4EF
MTSPRAAELRQRFRSLHSGEILVMPNPWDIGSAKLLAEVGATALATTSAGHAGANGRLDQNVQRDELLDHVVEMSTAVELPFNVDSEDCFGIDPAGVAETATLIAATDAAGFSIEDFDPHTGTIRSLEDGSARVAAAKEAGGDLVLTARAENHLYGVTDLTDTVCRLEAYRDAGADVVYAPGVTAPADIERLVSIGIPVNVLALPGAPTIPELAELGVARVSIGSMFAWAAYGALVDAARELLGPGTSGYSARMLDSALRDQAFR